MTEEPEKLAAEPTQQKGAITHEANNGDYYNSKYAKLWDFLLGTFGCVIYLSVLEFTIINIQSEYWIITVSIISTVMLFCFLIRRGYIALGLFIGLSAWLFFST